jgi:tRNA U34 5-carboxymethylaminomethyl modifying GTPase MnmE/TrmE
MTKIFSYAKTSPRSKDSNSRFVTLAGSPNSGKTSLFNALADVVLSLDTGATGWST